MPQYYDNNGRSMQNGGGQSGSPSRGNYQRRASDYRRDGNPPRGQYDDRRQEPPQDQSNWHDGRGGGAQGDGRGGSPRPQGSQGDMARCKFCGRDIQWIKGDSGKSLPFDLEKVKVLTDDGGFVGGVVQHNCRGERGGPARGGQQSRDGYDMSYGDQGRRGNGGMDDRR